MQIKGTPVVTDMRVIPVAGYDSMLLSLSGCHAPVFARNIVLITDSAGHTGIGETHGGEKITAALESYKAHVVGRPIGQWRGIVHELGHRRQADPGADGEGLQRLDLKKMLSFVVHAEDRIRPRDRRGSFHRGGAWRHSRQA